MSPSRLSHALMASSFEYPCSSAESVKMRSSKSKCYAPMSSRNSQMVKHGFSLVRGDQSEDIFPVLGGHQVEFGGHLLD